MSGWLAWEQTLPFVVSIEKGLSLVWRGQTLQVSRLILAGVGGTHRPEPLFERHAWVDVFLPAQLATQSESPGERL